MGYLLSSFFWTYAVGQFVAGWFTDRYPVKWVFAIGFGGQSVEVGCLDPGVAVRTQKTQVKAVANDDDDIHVSIDSIRCRRAGPTKSTGP